MPTPFSEAFVQLRKSAGFETSYKFFHVNGGIRVLGCSFSNYLRIENGTHLPKPQRLPLLCSLLRLPLRSSQRAALVRAYLRTWLGSEELTHWMLSPLEAPSGRERPPEPGRQAMAKLLHDTSRPVTARQFEVIMSSAAAYWSYRVLTSSRQAYGSAELARLVGLRPADVQRALRKLAGCRMATRLPDGRYRSELAGAFLVFPDSSLIPPALMQKVFRYNQAMIRRKGSLIDVRYCGVRADLWQLQGFVPHLRDAIRSVNAYSLTERTDQSAMVFVEGRVYKLFDF